MAEYEKTGEGLSLFEAQRWGSLEGRIGRVSARQFQIENPDGSITIYHGMHIGWDETAHRLCRGFVTSILHLDAAGQAIDQISGLKLRAATLGEYLSAPRGAANAAELARHLFNGDDKIESQSGVIALSGWGGNDDLSGGDGHDILIGGGGDDHIHGGAGNDRLIGKSGGDVLEGETGDDVLRGGRGKDFLTGSEGADKLFGGDGDDTIDGGTGKDMIKGGAGNDLIYGGPDPDVIIYDFAWEDLKVHYDGKDYSIWVEAPDGTDHVFSALTFASLTGTYRFDLPTQSWVFVSANTGDDWLGGLWT